MDHKALFPRSPSRRPRRSAGERRFNTILTVVMGLFGAGWSWGIAVAAESGTSTDAAERLTANPFDPGAAPEAAFLMDALVRSFADVDELRGISGDVRVVLTEPGEPMRLALPDSLPPEVVTELRPMRGTVVDLAAPGHPVRDSLAVAPAGSGVWALTLRAPDGQVTEVPDVRVIVQVPSSRRLKGAIGAYNVGEWPFEKKKAPQAIYATPRGLVEVTLENMTMPISEHFLLGDFLTKGQAETWPKYVVMSSRLLDKLELTIQQLEADGHAVNDVGIISGFRTPYYNAHGGNTEGRGSLSRHMYGDAMDFYIDNDGDKSMDDLNGDGKVDVGDARVIAAAAEQVEKDHPSLIGGIGIYRPTGAHRGFVHLDTRGFRARW